MRGARVFDKHLNANSRGHGKPDAYHHSPLAEGSCLIRAGLNLTTNKPRTFIGWENNLRCHQVFAQPESGFSYRYSLQAAGLVDTLKGAGPFTVFAPTDEPFAKLPAGTVDELSTRTGWMPASSMTNRSRHNKVLFMGAGSLPIFQAHSGEHSARKIGDKP